MHGGFLRFEDETTISCLHQLPQPSLRGLLGTFVVGTCADMLTATTVPSFLSVFDDRMTSLWVARNLLVYEEAKMFSPSTPPAVENVL